MTALSYTNVVFIYSLSTPLSMMGEQFRLSLRILNSFLVFWGTIAIIVGGLGIGYACQNVNHGWPATSGVGVWAGVVVSPIVEKNHWTLDISWHF